MREFLDILRRDATYRDLLSAVRRGESVSAEGLWGSSAGFLASCLVLDRGGLGLAVLPRLDQAEQFAGDVAAFAPEAISFFPAWEAFDADEEPDPDIVSRRLLLLRQILDRGMAPDGAGKPKLLVAPVAALIQEVVAPADLAESGRLVRRGAPLDLDETLAWLVEHRFRSAFQVEVPGEFARRGGILDVFPYGSSEPYRIDLFGDDVDSIRTFDPETQVSREEVEACEILAPSRPTAGDAIPAATLFDYLPADVWLVLVDPQECLDRAAALHAVFEESAEAGREGANHLQRALARYPSIALTETPGGASGKIFTFEVHSVQRAGQGLQAILGDLAGIVERSPRTVVICEIGRLHRGFEWVDLQLALVPHHDIFNRYRQRRPQARFRHTAAVEDFTDLRPGDHVVHFHHGIGLYRGLKRIRRAGEQQEVLAIEYRNGAILYVAVGRIELVQKYIGPSSHRPPLNTLGSGTWAERREKAREAAEELALELLETQAARQSLAGFACAEDNEWQHEFEAAFIYEETEDQLSVAEEIRRDMRAKRVMDRLICGDVGYGKTELAMRAAFRAVSNGRQVAVLVPTTVLAAQHARTFGERMADYPVRIEMLSRFRTRGEQAKVLEEVAAGRVDIVIGTHRLLQKDVVFQDLGLAIIDEEQRFGVRHKEHFKQMRRKVDVLTLTATPIPRTLHMALLGIRDISTLGTPPMDRLAIRTRLWRFNRHKIRQAILHELARDGQVFVVNDRVHDIEKLACMVREVVPEASAIVGHGQMPERRLQERMEEFVRGEADVLVCTTIIQSGLDIPRVNTIIINRAQNFGLADLHQLRGRVGRYKHRAYAYLLIPEKGPVTPKAEKRLKAIEEYAELGAGFQIALRDLEIRGAGNILGAEQHGHLLAIGYDLYCRLLTSAIRKARGEKEEADDGLREVTLALRLPAFLSEDYVPDARHRMEVYRRLSRVGAEGELEGIVAEIRDRFGRLPGETESLLLEARLRIRARAAGIRAVYLDDGFLRIRPENIATVQATLSCVSDRVRMVDEDTIHLLLHDSERTPVGAARALLEILALEDGDDRDGPS